MRLRNIKVYYDNGDGFGSGSNHLIGIMFDQMIKDKWEPQVVSFTDVIRSAYAMDIVKSLLKHDMAITGFNVDYGKALDGYKIKCVEQDFACANVGTEVANHCYLAHFAVLIAGATTEGESGSNRVFTWQTADYSIKDMFLNLADCKKRATSQEELLLLERYEYTLDDMLEDTLKLRLFRSERQSTMLEEVLELVGSNRKEYSCIQKYIWATKFDHMFRTSQIIATVDDFKQNTNLFKNNMMGGLTRNKLINEFLQSSKVAPSEYSISPILERKYLFYDLIRSTEITSVTNPTQALGWILLADDAIMPYNKPLVDRCAKIYDEQLTPVMKLFENNKGDIQELGANVSSVPIPDYASLIYNFGMGRLEDATEEISGESIDDTNLFQDEELITYTGSNVVKSESDGSVTLNIADMIKGIMRRENVTSTDDMHKALSFKFVDKYDVRGNFFFISSSFSRLAENEKKLDAITPNNLKVYPEAVYKNDGSSNSHSFLADYRMSGRSLAGGNIYNGYQENNRLALGLREQEWIDRFRGVIDACVLLERGSVPCDVAKVTEGMGAENMREAYVLRPQCLTDFMFKELLEPISVMTRGFSGRVTLKLEHTSEDDESDPRPYENYPDIKEGEGGDIIINAFRPDINDNVFIEVDNLKESAGAEALESDSVAMNFKNRFVAYFNNNAIGTYAVPEVIVKLIRSGEWLKPQVLYIPGARNDINLNTLEISKGLSSIRKDRYSHSFEISSVMVVKNIGPDDKQRMTTNLYGNTIQGLVPVGVIIKARHMDIPSAYISYAMSFRSLYDFMRTKIRMNIKGKEVQVYPVVSGMSFSERDGKIVACDANEYGWIPIEPDDNCDWMISGKQDGLDDTYLMWNKLGQLPSYDVIMNSYDGDFEDICDDRARVRSKLFENLNNQDGNIKYLYGINADWTYHKQPQLLIVDAVNLTAKGVKSLDLPPRYSEERFIFQPGYEDKLKAYMDCIKLNQNKFSDAKRIMSSMMPAVFRNESSEMAYLFSVLKGTLSKEERGSGDVVTRLKNIIKSGGKYSSLNHNIDQGIHVEVLEAFENTLRVYSAAHGQADSGIYDIRNVLSIGKNFIEFIEASGIDYMDLEDVTGNGTTRSGMLVTVDYINHVLEDCGLVTPSELTDVPKAKNRFWYVLVGKISGKNIPFAAIYFDTDSDDINRPGSGVEIGIIPMRADAKTSDADKITITEAYKAFLKVFQKDPSVRGNHVVKTNLAVHIMLSSLFKDLFVNGEQVFGDIAPSDFKTLDDVMRVVKKAYQFSGNMVPRDSVRLLTEDSAKDFLKLMYLAVKGQ